MNSRPRVVYDCNVLLQALISTRGPAWGAIEAVHEGRAFLFLLDYLFAELRDVTRRPHLAEKFALTDLKVEKFIETIESCAQKLTEIPHVFDCQRDSKDSHYVDLAVAASASLIVSRDAHLLALGDLATLEGRDFAARFPALRILTPPQLLAELDR